MKTNSIIASIEDGMSDRKCDDVESSGVKCLNESIMEPAVWCDYCKIQYLIAFSKRAMSGVHSAMTEVAKERAENRNK